MTNNEKKKPLKYVSKGTQAKSGTRSVPKTTNEHSYSAVNKNSVSEGFLTYSCSVCELVLGDDDAIQCKICDYLYCVHCSGTTQNVYEEFETSDLNENFIWYCNTCKKTIPGVKQVMIMVSNIKESYDEMKIKLNRIENKISESCTENVVDHKIDQALHDFKERKLRKNNLILYNLPESNALESADVPDDIVRLVERKTENRAKPRPVKVIFYSENTRGKFLINSKKFRDVSEFKKVTVTPDYTFRQRKMNNQIKSEVASRRQTHPIFNYVRLKEELAGTISKLSDLEIQATEVLGLQVGKGSSRIPRLSGGNLTGSPGHRIINNSQKYGRRSPENKPGADGHGPPLERGSGFPSSRK